MNQLDQLQRFAYERKNIFDQEIQHLGQHITLEPSVECSPGFSGDVILTILTFIFGAITGGALSAMGSDIWLKIKEASHAIVTRSNQTGDRTTVHLRAEFRLADSGRRFVYIVKDPSSFLIDTFWDETYLDMVANITNHQDTRKREPLVVCELIQDSRKLSWKVKKCIKECK